MLKRPSIGSHHCHYIQVFSSKLGTKSQKNGFFEEKKTRSLKINRLSLISNDDLNILIKPVSCSTVF